MCAAALFPIDLKKKLLKAHKYLVSKKSQILYFRKLFQNAMKGSLKGKLKYKTEKTGGFDFKAELKFLVMLSVKQSVWIPFFQGLIPVMG